jgi:hypothetical protein
LGTLGQRSRSQGLNCQSDFYSLSWLQFITKSSYFTYWLVITSRWPLFFWVTRSKVKVTGALNGNMISAYYLGLFITKSSFFTYWLVVASTWPLFILGSPGQRSRSQDLWMVKDFCSLSWKIINIKSSYFTYW